MLRWMFLSIIFLSGFWCVNEALSVDRSDLVAYWSFDKGSGKTVTDDSDNGHEGTITDADWVKVGCYSKVERFCRCRF